MSKRDSWDKHNRQKKVFNPDYREEMKGMPRTEDASVNNTNTGIRLIKKWKLPQFCSAVREWLINSQIDEKRVLNQVNGELNTIKYRAQLFKQGGRSGIAFFLWNDAVARAEKLHPFKMPKVPKQLIPWLLKFKSRAERGEQRPDTGSTGAGHTPAPAQTANPVACAARAVQDARQWINSTRDSITH